jgi:hypothetical protein
MLSKILWVSLTSCLEENNLKINLLGKKALFAQKLLTMYDQKVSVPTRALGFAVNHFIPSDCGVDLQ